MPENKKPRKVEFAPGCFDSFEGTQEELNELIAEIQNTFANITDEELEARSRPLSDEMMAELGEDIAECKNAKAESVRNVINGKRILH